jgi:hypothetical protein
MAWKSARSEWLPVAFVPAAEVSILISMSGLSFQGSW